VGYIRKERKRREVVGKGDGAENSPTRLLEPGGLGLFVTIPCPFTLLFSLSLDG